MQPLQSFSHLPIFVIINNNGIGMGFSDLPEDRFQSPAMAYTIEAGYEKMIEGFGGKGYSVRTPEELSASLKQALDDSMSQEVTNHLFQGCSHHHHLIITIYHFIKTIGSIIIIMVFFVEIIEITGSN